MKKFYMLTLMAMTLTLSAPAAVQGQKFSKRNVSGLNKAAEMINSRAVVALEEDFSKFTEGSESNPASEPLATDWYGSFDESKVSVKGWGGNGVYEAGGAAFLKESSALWSPIIDMSDAVNNNIVITFRARLGENAESGVPTIAMGYG
ncbi:MAG: hypothetical protein K2M54_00285, partial [Muribaculaceae bacterium]|nr:hypothetical protein [Muribaculaceae bacterium]